MKNLYGVLLVVVVVAGAFPITLAQTRHKVHGGNDGAKAVESDKRGADALPLVVQIHDIQSDKEFADQAAQAAEQKRINRWNISLTFAIAICALLQVVGIAAQIVVYLKQTKIMGDTLAAINTQGTHMAGQLIEMTRQADLMEYQAKESTTTTAATLTTLGKQADAAMKSAEAAKASANIAVGSSLPMLVVDELCVPPLRRQIDSFFQDPIIQIKIRNYGQTPAFLKWWGLRFSCEDLPEKPDYGATSNGMVLKKAVIEPGDTFTLPPIESFRRQQFSDDNAKAVISREKPFSVYGYVCYGDIFGSPLKQMKFCECVLNIFGGEDICDWWEGLAPTAYTGVEVYSRSQETGD